MKESWRSLIALTVACTVAATIFGFGAQVFAWRSVYHGLGREDLIQATRLFVFVALGVLLAFRGGWRGVVAAIIMATAATSLEWVLFPYSYAWATLDDPAGYARPGPAHHGPRRSQTALETNTVLHFWFSCEEDEVRKGVREKSRGLSWNA